jgi:hypothetical protein
MSNATSANEAAGFDGMTVKSYASGDTNGDTVRHWHQDPLRDRTDRWRDPLHWRNRGRLDTAATTGDAVGIARAISATLIRITRDVSGAAVSGAAMTAGSLPVSKLATFKSTEQTGTGARRTSRIAWAARPAS